MAKKTDIKTIRAAVQANRGGWTEATDAAILKLWNSLGTDVQATYLETLKPKGKPHADGNGS